MVALSRRFSLAADLHRLSQSPRYRGTQDHRRGNPVGHRGKPCQPGQGRNGDRAARSSRTRGCQRPFQRAARRHQAADRFRGRQDRRRLRRQLQARLSLRTRDPGSVRSAHRRAEGHPRCQRHHRHAHRRGDRDRRQASGAQELEDPRPYRRARHRLLERAAAQSSLRFRRDPRAFPARREPQQLCRAAEPRSRQEGRRHPGLAELRRGRRHRGRGFAARQARRRC